MMPAGLDDSPPPGSITDSQSDSTNAKPPRTDAHLSYALHFPIPNTSSDSHDYNQRLVLLYGFGNPRKRLLNKLKNITADLKKLFAFDEIPKAAKKPGKDGKKDSWKKQSKVSQAEIIRWVYMTIHFNRYVVPNFYVLR